MTIMGRVEGCIGVLKDTLPKLGDGVSASTQLLLTPPSVNYLCTWCTVCVVPAACH